MSKMEHDAFRPLSSAEIEMVAGGADEPTDSGEIVVTGTRMTNEQKMAWDSAHERASWEINSTMILDAGILAALATRGGAVGAGTAGSAYEILDQNREAAIDGLTDLYYQADGADGSFDGDIQPIFNGTFNPYIP